MSSLQPTPQSDHSLPDQANNHPPHPQIPLIPNGPAQNVPTIQPSQVSNNLIPKTPIKTESMLPPFGPLAFGPISGNTLPRPINGIIPRQPMPFQARIQLVTSAIMLLNNLEKNNPEFAKACAYHLECVKQARTAADLEKYYFLIFAIKYNEQHKEENIMPELISKLTFMAEHTDIKLPDHVDVTGGVIFDEFWGSGNLGTNRPLGRWVACWEHQGRYFRRGFPVSLFGYNGAKELAENYFVNRKRAMQLSAHNLELHPVKVKKTRTHTRGPKQTHKHIADSGDPLRFDQTNGKWYFESLEGRQYSNTQREAAEAFRAMKTKILRSYTESNIPGVNFERNRICWCVTHWVPSKGVRRTRYYNINKHGWKRAKSLAITYKQLSDSLGGEEPNERLVFEQADPNTGFPDFMLAILDEIKYKQMPIGDDRREKSSARSGAQQPYSGSPVKEEQSQQDSSTPSSQPDTPIATPQTTAPQVQPPQVANPQPANPQQVQQPPPGFQNMFPPFPQMRPNQSPFPDVNTTAENINISFSQRGPVPSEGDWEVRWTSGGSNMFKAFSTFQYGRENAQKMAHFFISKLQSQSNIQRPNSPVQQQVFVDYPKTTNQNSTNDS